MSNKDLHPILSNVSNGISELKTKVQSLIGEVQKLHETLKEGIETIVDAINDNTQAQAEIKLIDEMTEVHSLEPQITAEKETIDEEREELEESLGSIGERYADKHDELDRKVEERIRDVGEHIFEIDEDEFEASVENPFVEHVTGMWDELREHNERAQSSREGALRRAVDLANDAIERFGDRRESLLNGIDDHRTNLELEIDEPTVVQVPFWEIEMQKNVQTRTVIVGPAELKRGHGWNSASIQQCDNFDTVLHSVSGRSPSTVSKHEMDRSDLVRAIDKYGEQRLGGLVSYTDVFESAISEGVRIEIER